MHTMVAFLANIESAESKIKKKLETVTVSETNFSPVFAILCALSFPLNAAPKNVS